MSEECIFCKIVKGEIPSIKIYEDNDFLVFMDIFPIVKGHSLIIPKEHYRNALDTPEHIGAKMYPLITKIANSVKKAYNADGIGIMQFNEPAAGQEVFHSHVHILPRFKDDNVKISIPQRLKLDMEEIKAEAEKIKKFI